MRRVFASVVIGVAAYWLAIGVGIPAWRTWKPGDASDIGAFIGWGVFWAIGSARKRPDGQREAA